MAGIYWLASYPKSGNTWFRAFLRNLRQDGEAPVDINELHTGDIASARGWLDEVLGFDTADLMPAEVERLRPAVYRWALQDGHIGYHKIHDRYCFTAAGDPLVSREGTLGALYIIRNPLDVAPSVANHWHCTIDQAIARMGDPRMAMCCSRTALLPQVRQCVGSWSEHVVSWVDAPGLEVQVIRFEDMLAAPFATFTRAAAFLALPQEAGRVDKAIRFSAFRELAQQEEERGFRERPQHSERFFRRGRSGDWREQLTAQQIERIITDHAETMQRFGYLDA